MARALPPWATECIPWDDLTRGERRTLQRLVVKRRSADEALHHWPSDLDFLLPHVLRARERYEAHEAGSLESAASPRSPTSPKCPSYGRPPDEPIEVTVQRALRELGDVEDTMAALTEWARAYGIDDLLQWSERNLAYELGDRHWHYASYGRVLTQLQGRYRPAAQRIGEALSRRLQMRETLEYLRPVWASAPVPAVLEPLRQHLLQALDLAHVPLTSGSQMFTRTDPVRIGIVERHDERVIDLEDLPPVAELRHQQRLVISVLQWLVTPETAGSREELVQALQTPREQRDLEALLFALDGALAFDPEQLSAWILAERQGRWELVRALATPKVRGGYKVKNFLRAKHQPAEPLPCDERAEARATLVGSLDELRDHPRVFVRRGGRCDGLPKRVRRLEVALDLREADGLTDVGLSIGGQRIDPGDLAGPPERVRQQWWVRSTDTHIDVVHLSRAVLAVLKLQARRGALRLPQGTELLARLPALTEQLPVQVDDDLFGTPVAADPRPLVRLELVGTELDVVARVQPLPEAPSQPVGRGSQVVAGERGGEVVHVRRDLAAEERAVRALLAPVELPASGRVDDGEDAGFQWHIDGVQDALDVVQRLRGLGDAVAMHWGGERPVLATGEMTADAVSLQVAAKGRDWFGLGGTVEVDGQQVALGSVLEAAMEGLHWVSLSDGQWARLSEGLRSLLLSAGTLEEKGGERRLQAIHAGTLQPLVDAGATLEAPTAWLERAQRATEAATLAVTRPEGVQAILRPYQEEGVTWLLRLAHWAPGAVLADDMGLGKTLQTLVVLLARADRPSLVVAPTSLVHNWQREAERFTPGLTMSVYHGSGRTLDAAPGTVVLTTYGVLVNDVDALSAVSFGTVVFDEAQAVKNPSAQRTKAARQLDAAFVIALSGTPVENRTAELWSLFSVVAPGLLGGAPRFRETFVNPIEVDGDPQRREALARRVGSFVLRRTKAQVASDLPPRTELVRRVVLSPAEQALYDRARLSAVARMGQAEGGRFQVFQELLRLRQLACHPRLADAHSDVPSSKLRAIRRLLADVRDAGERALVFSTFTTHLALVREALQADGFVTRYLDGSMSPRQRLAEVDAFQGGDGDVFLISTKAGGVGLNLTAATVVVHIDPWWNPASEDQATDRAHRIGQDKPVTVVRLVSAGTIEEQIVALHATKRGLADALLAHSGSTRQVTVDELVALLSDDPDALPELEEPPLASALPSPKGASSPKGAPSPKKASSPKKAASPQKEVIVGLADRFTSHLEQLHATGVMKTRNTVRSYDRAVRHYLAWRGGDPAPAEVLAERPAFIARTKEGGYPHKSDKVYASPALKRLAAWLDEA